MKCEKGRQTMLQKNRVIFLKNSQNHMKHDLVASHDIQHFIIFYFSSVLKTKYALNWKGVDM